MQDPGIEILQKRKLKNSRGVDGYLLLARGHWPRTPCNYCYTVGWVADINELSPRIPAHVDDSRCTVLFTQIYVDSPGAMARAKDVYEEVKIVP